MRNRPDQDGKAKATFKKLKKTIYASQTNCALCGRPVDFSLTFPNPWSATIDHIIPIAKGGNPASLENLQLAHLQCNRMKGTKLRKPDAKPQRVSNRGLPLSCDWTTIFNNE